MQRLGGLTPSELARRAHFQRRMRMYLIDVNRIAYRDSPLYYGRDGTDRYDAPTRDYGVLYLDRDLPIGSVFHKHQWLAA